MRDLVQACIANELVTAYTGLIIGLILFIPSYFLIRKALKGDDFDGPLWAIPAICLIIAGGITTSINTVNLIRVKSVPEWVCRYTDEGVKVTHEKIER